MTDIDDVNKILDSIKEKDKPGSQQQVVKCELEIYLARWYRREGGWRATVGEVYNFDTGANWALLAMGYDSKTGWEFSVST